MIANNLRKSIITVALIIRISIMKATYFYLTLFIVAIQLPCRLTSKTHYKSTIVDTITDIKDFKKLLRTKTNVLVCFKLRNKQTAIIKTFREVAVVVKGLGTLALIDCSSEAQKKLCKKLKMFAIDERGYVLKHYKDGEFNKDYDRLESVASMVNFMRDPSGDIPWEEDVTAANVAHIQDANSLAKFLKRESKPILVMFYAPWCGFCKSLKPEYSQAADDLLGESILAAIDVNRPENNVVRTQYNITGFPTLLYYENGTLQYAYDGENSRTALVSFMRHPAPPRPINANATRAPSLTTEPDWSEQDNEVVHLTTSNFDPVLKEESSVLVMFYAPWCGHCKRMKPEYEEAATILKKDGIGGMLAALDCTQYPQLASRFNIRGYPTLKYFAYGEERYEVKHTARTAPHLVAFMRNPEEPTTALLNVNGDGNGDATDIPWADDAHNVVHLDERSFKSFLRKKKHVLVMFYTPWCSHCKNAKPEFSKAADKFKHDPKVEFAAVDCTSEPGLCNANDIKGYPTIRYFSYHTKLVKNYSGSRTEVDFVQFMSNPPSISPEPAGTNPDSPDGGTAAAAPKWKFVNVTKLTDNTFNSHIDSDRPVLVMFYAPWCAHCRRLKPEFDKAAASLTTEGISASFAVVDCTENPEVAEKYEIIGFPTIKLFKNGKFVRDYTGKRKQDDLREFMRAAQKIKVKDEL